MTEQETIPGSNGSDSPAPGVSTEVVGAESLKPVMPPTEPIAKCVTPEEVLLGENYTLRVMNISLLKQAKEAEVAKLEGRLMREQQELLLYRQKLAEKYNIDFNRFEIEAETGEIIPAGSKK